MFRLTWGSRNKVPGELPAGLTEGKLKHLRPTTLYKKTQRPGHEIKYTRPIYPRPCYSLEELERLL